MNKRGKSTNKKIQQTTSNDIEESKMQNSMEEEKKTIQDLNKNTEYLEHNNESVSRENKPKEIESSEFEGSFDNDDNDNKK